MFAQLLDAVGQCPIPALDEFVQKRVYSAWGQALITDEQLQAICEAAHERRNRRRAWAQAQQGIAAKAHRIARHIKLEPRVPGTNDLPALTRSILPARQQPSMPRADTGALTRRRKTVSSGAMPPQVAALFSEAERAAMSVIAHDVRRSRACEMTVPEIASRAGVSERTVRYALAKARRSELISVQERRRAFLPNLPNRVTIVSREWRSWLSPRKPSGGGKDVQGTDKFSRFNSIGEGNAHRLVDPARMSCRSDGTTEITRSETEPAEVVAERRTDRVQIESCARFRVIDSAHGRSQPQADSLLSRSSMRERAFAESRTDSMRRAEKELVQHVAPARHPCQRIEPLHVARMSHRSGGLPIGNEASISRPGRDTGALMTGGAMFCQWKRIWSGLAFGLAIWAGPVSAQDICVPRQAENRSYTVCTIDLRRYAIRLFWKGADGEVLGPFNRLRSSPEGSRLVFAMNAGMYHEDRSPVGLYVENGREIQKANTANGPGNFHLKPNGVFFVSGRTAGVLETSRYLEQRPRADYATQSGPMLVINGRIHPKFSRNGTSRKIRNGVGIRDKHTAVFAISDEPVTFAEFARLFKEELGCANALFLDGSVSSLYAPELGRADGLLPMGPIIGALPYR